MYQGRVPDLGARTLFLETLMTLLLKKLALLTPWLLVGCASTAPVLYQPATPTPQQQARAMADVQACLQRADSAIGRNALQAGGGRQQAAKNVGKVAGIAFVASAVGNTVNRSKAILQKSTAAAAGGAAGAGLLMLLDWDAPDEAYEHHVERCLSDKGHDVVGWR